MSFKYWFGPVEDAAAYWLKFGILILIWIWSLVFNTPMSQILALCLDFEITKNIYVLLVLIWAFGGCWRFLTFVWNIDLDLDMVPGLWYNLVPNFVSLSWFWRCKEHLCLFKSWLGALEDARGSWLGFGILILIWIWSLAFDTPSSKFWLYIFIFKAQRRSMSFKSSFGAS